MPFLHERLPNGLDVVAETTEAAVSTSVGFFVATGARDGMQVMEQSLGQLVARGVISMEEAVAVSSYPEDIAGYQAQALASLG